jgi:hypothetical protein
MTQPEPHRSLVDKLVSHRRIVFIGVLGVTILIGLFAPSLNVDPSLESGIDTTSHEYVTYQAFERLFGSDQFILTVLRFPEHSDRGDNLNRISSLTRDFLSIPNVINVLSVSDLEVFRERNGMLGSYPIATADSGEMSLPDPEQLRRLRSSIPAMDMLISDDLRTYGILIRIADDCRLHPARIGIILNAIRSKLGNALPVGAEYRLVGGPVIIHAIQRYNIRTAWMFGLLSSLACTLVSLYIFKTFRATVVTLIVVGISVVWVIGLMSLSGIGLNSTTGLAFGLILIVSVAAVIHLVTHFNEAFQTARNKTEAIRHALAVAGRPCLMCALTTATGFASIMVSPVPMVRELGFIMSLGVLIAYALAVLTAPVLLSLMPAPSERMRRRMANDWLSVLFTRLEHLVFTHFRLCVAVGISAALVMLCGAPRITGDTQLLKQFSSNTQEVRDIAWTEKHLAPIRSLELMIVADHDDFRAAALWEKVHALENRLNDLPHTARTDSLLGILGHLASVVSDGDMSRSEMFARSGLIPQLLTMMSLSAGGEETLSRYVSPDFSTARVTVRLSGTEIPDIGPVIDRVKAVAENAIGDVATVSVTGIIAVFDAQASKLVRAQTLSLFLAVSCITGIMMLQFRSVLMGMLSLIPNLLPLAVIFGIMGWLGIPLDNVTVFAAVVSIGLSVDDTIHYLTQLKREISRGIPGDSIEACLSRAYRVTAKALLSTTAVLFFGFLTMLIGSPFRSVAAFGILGSSAILAALIGDLVLLPALVLTFPRVRRLIERKMASRST